METQEHKHWILSVNEVLSQIESIVQRPVDLLMTKDSTYEWGELSLRFSWQDEQGREYGYLLRLPLEVFNETCQSCDILENDVLSVIWHAERCARITDKQR